MVYQDSIERGRPLYMVHFDFFKAYDSVELNVMLKILKVYSFGLGLREMTTKCTGIPEGL